MRIAITGGAGFIGSHLCERLLGNIEKFMNNPRFEWIRHDVIHPIFLENIEQIYHLACPASPVHYQHNSIRTIKTNVMGTTNMLGLAKRMKARFLLASTSEVYGDPHIHPQPESYWGNVNPDGPRACYDEGKRVAETLSFCYHRQNGVDIRVARIFNTYGPNMLSSDGRVVSNFIVQALQGDPITIYGTGEQTRSFCYVEDLVTGLIKLMNHDHIGPINLGNDKEFTMKELVDVIKSHVPESKSTMVYEPLPEDDPKKRRPDLTLARTLLGYEPTVFLDEGIKRTVEYFKKDLKREAEERALLKE